MEGERRNRDTDCATMIDLEKELQDLLDGMNALQQEQEKLILRIHWQEGAIMALKTLIAKQEKARQENQPDSLPTP